MKVVAKMKVIIRQVLAHPGYRPWMRAFDAIVVAAIVAAIVWAI